MHKKTKQYTTTHGNCVIQNICTVGVQSVYAKWPYSLLCAGPRAANGRIPVGCVTKHLSYCVNCIIYRVFEKKKLKILGVDGIGHCENKSTYEHVSKSGWLQK